MSGVIRTGPAIAIRLLAVVAFAVFGVHFIAASVVAQRNISAYAFPAVVTVETRAGTGSGFFVHPEGYLVTNEHVVRGHQRVTIALLPGNRYEADVVFVDRNSDVAVLLLERRNVPTLRLADDTTVAPGDEVLAVGAPLGLGHTVTRGVIGGIRERNGTKMLQTDAAVNRGNSGGPLLNENGEVVGMISSGLVDAQGIAFAVSTEELVRALDEIGIAFNTALVSERFGRASSSAEARLVSSKRMSWVEAVILGFAIFGAVRLVVGIGWSAMRFLRRRSGVRLRHRRGGRRGPAPEDDDIQITFH